MCKTLELTNVRIYTNQQLMQYTAQNVRGNGILSGLYKIHFFLQKKPLALFKIGVDKKFSKSVGKHLGRCFFFNKFAGLHFTKKRLRDRCFLVNFEKFLKTLVFMEHLQWLLLFSSTLQITAGDT